jgi:hypothetical protein
VSQYRIVSIAAELPFGFPFTTIETHPMPTGELALFSVGERFGDNLIVGRWYPNIGGYDWIKQPSGFIKVTKDVILWIVGLIIPLRTHRPCLN